MSAMGGKRTFAWAPIPDRLLARQQYFGGAGWDIPVPQASNPKRMTMTPSMSS
jgi:hypothetical protein